MDEIQIPIAFCGECKQEVPVVIEEIKGDEWNLDVKTALTIIYCPQCQTLLNMVGDVEVRYFTPAELKKAGWAVSDANGRPIEAG